MPFPNSFAQVPTASVTVEGAQALNRVRWASGGKEVAVGDSEGRVWIYDVGEVRGEAQCVYTKITLNLLS